MKAYRWSVNLKLGLILLAVALAVASLWYTNSTVERLREREQSVLQLYASAYGHLAEAERQSVNPHQEQFAALADFLGRLERGERVEADTEAMRGYQSAVRWAQGMPPAGEINFITNALLVPNSFEIPAIIADTGGTPLFWRNLPRIPETLADLDSLTAVQAQARIAERLADMREAYEPVEIQLAGAEAGFVQVLYYDESALVGQLRMYPYVQLLVVGLFILVGYVGFSYVRRSEQSNLWVGMAKEAAHQLGTPISSLLGWVQLLRTDALDAETKEQAYDEIENDIARLQRVTARFSDIGSRPKLEAQLVAPVVESVAGYIRRRIPKSKDVTLEVDVPQHVHARLNPELFEWVIENLLKNALDAMEGQEGRITITGEEMGDCVRLCVTDTGKGIDRSARKNIFRPGYSTKRRGWGLGLSLAKRIVEEYHGGSLTLAQSRPGLGSTFQIEVPLVEAAG
jgi:signal transduction histidine kinase